MHLPSTSSCISWLRFELILNSITVYVVYKCVFVITNNTYNRFQCHFS